MRRVLVLSVAIGLLIGAVCGSSFAQEVQLKNDPTLPLQIVSVSPPRPNGEPTLFHGVVITVQNTGKVPCVAFAVSLVLELSNSHKLRVGFREDHNALGYAKVPSSDEIEPGSTYTMRNTTRVGPPIPAGITVTAMQASVDYIETADGKNYGPDADNIGMIVRMTRWGHAAERARLLKIYNTQGLQALLDELRRP